MLAHTFNHHLYFTFLISVIDLGEKIHTRTTSKMTDSSELLKKQASISGDADLDLENLDELLSQLTQEEIDELTGDYDPDVSLV